MHGVAVSFAPFAVFAKPKVVAALAASRFTTVAGASRTRTRSSSIPRPARGSAGSPDLAAALVVTTRKTGISSEAIVLWIEGSRSRNQSLVSSEPSAVLAHHRHRRVAIDEGAVAQTPVDVVAPRGHGAVALQRHAARAAAGDLHDVAQLRHGNRAHLAVAGAIAQLAPPVRAPRDHGAVGLEREGERIARGDLRDVGGGPEPSRAPSAAYWCRRRARPIVLAPRPHRAVVLQRERVPRAGGHGLAAVREPPPRRSANRGRRSCRRRARARAVAAPRAQFHRPSPRACAAGTMEISFAPPSPGTCVGESRPLSSPRPRRPP